MYEFRLLHQNFSNKSFYFENIYSYQKIATNLLHARNFWERSQGIMNSMEMKLFHTFFIFCPIVNLVLGKLRKAQKRSFPHLVSGSRNATKIRNFGKCAIALAMSRKMDDTIEKFIKIGLTTLLKIFRIVHCARRKIQKTRK